MSQAQAVSIVTELVNETVALRRQAITESGFHKELIDQTRVDEIFLQAEKLPTSGIRFNLLGRMYCLKDDERQACRYHTLATNMEPGNTMHYLDFGVTLETFGRYGEATNEYQKALRVNKRDERALDLIIKALIILKRYEEASDYLDKLLEITPDDEALLRKKEMLIDEIYPEEQFQEEFVKNVEVSAKEAESGHAKAFNTIEEIESYLADLPNA